MGMPLCNKRETEKVRRRLSKITCSSILFSIVAAKHSSSLLTYLQVVAGLQKKIGHDGGMGGVDLQK